MIAHSSVAAGTTQTCINFMSLPSFSPDHSRYFPLKHLNFGCSGTFPVDLQVVETFLLGVKKPFITKFMHL